MSKLNRGVACVSGLIALAMILFAMACSDDNVSPSTSATPLATMKSPTVTTQIDPAPDSNRRVLEVSTYSSQAFDKSKIQVGPGEWSIKFTNSLEGFTCNFHLFSGDDALGESVAETQLAPGPDAQTLDLSLESGMYYFQCDAHPELHGRLDVHY